MTKKRIAIGLLSIIIIVSIVFAISWTKFLYSPIITNEAGYQYTVQPGSSIKVVIQNLYSKKIIRNRFYLYLKFTLSTWLY